MAKLSLKALVALATFACLALAALGSENDTLAATTSEAMTTTTENATTTTNSSDGLVGGTCHTAADGLFSMLAALARRRGRWSKTKKPRPHTIRHVFATPTSSLAGVPLGAH
eukprot:CAMPEP_0170334142 /NCGR_PEP_ID=MMETSP0116_2-20130129/68102_1 /TAXON_ID=400756 /ORGANISM="Durinskia baltica, Strain CSIRO CS-38" /LENGTH=111 /DNA_ID=CAMNT_0010587507 /DNA_START=85 /DNA_END=417 /DNA_ORIENTATION=+